MNYALGCGFTVSELFENFSLKKLKLTCNQCKDIINDRHRNILAVRIFMDSIKVILEDIIENNATFVLPLPERKKCTICMEKFSNEKFMKLRKCGKWKDVDYLKSGFTGYQLTLKMFGNGMLKTKPIYVNKEYKSRITLHTNEGMQYGDGKNETTLRNYFEKIYELYPKVPKTDILKILNFGWKSLYLHNSYGGDVNIRNQDLWMYIGFLRKSALYHYHYYREKLAIKLRILYKRRKIEWDGYYYFGLYSSQYEEIFLPLKRGRKIKYRTFKGIFLYLILDECKVKLPYCTHIFRIPYISHIGFKKYIPEIRTDKAELILTRNPLKFKDLLTSENKYDVL